MSPMVARRSMSVILAVGDHPVPLRTGGLRDNPPTSLTLLTASRTAREAVDCSRSVPVIVDQDEVAAQLLDVLP